MNINPIFDGPAQPQSAAIASARKQRTKRPDYFKEIKAAARARGNRNQPAPQPQRGGFDPQPMQAMPAARQQPTPLSMAGTMAPASMMPMSAMSARPEIQVPENTFQEFLPSQPAPPAAPSRAEVNRTQQEGIRRSVPGIAMQDLVGNFVNTFNTSFRDPDSDELASSPARRRQVNQLRNAIGYEGNVDVQGILDRLNGTVSFTKGNRRVTVSGDSADQVAELQAQGFKREAQPKRTPEEILNAFARNALQNEGVLPLPSRKEVNVRPNSEDPFRKGFTAKQRAAQLSGKSGKRK